jgi:tRNA threonylcarbamoyladenosine biosynthesis protein TsaE
MERTVEDAEALRSLAAALGACAPAGSVVALSGDLGSGKTTFAQGFARGLGVSGDVVSPTFVLVSQYDSGTITLIHADLYRIESDAELGELGLDEWIGGDAVVLIEWADLYPGLLPEDHLRVTFTHLPDGRLVRLEATGPSHRRWLEGSGVG